MNEEHLDLLQEAIDIVEDLEPVVEPEDSVSIPFVTLKLLTRLAVQALRNRQEKDSLETYYFIQDWSRGTFLADPFDIA